MKMNHKEWIEESVVAREDGDVSIDCGHDRYDYFLPFREYDPHVYLVLCTPCYRNLFGFFFEEICTIKFDKLRI
jgi:hypothetical protein